MPNFDITISPAQIEYLLKPNVTITQAYEITNNSSENIYLNSEVLPFIPQGNNGSVTYQNITSNPNIIFSLSNANITLGQPFVLGPNAKQQLVLKIKTSPQTNLADSYYTFFVYQTKSQSSTNFPVTTGRIGSHILLSLTNTENIKNSGEVSKFTIQPKIKDVFFTPLKFSGEVKNNSDYFFKTTGKITLTKNEKVVKEIDLTSNNVLANYYRQINCQNSTNCTLSPPFWPGRYTATLSFDENLHIPASSISFFVVPFSPLAILILIFLLVFIPLRFKKYFSKPKN
jgi:hypothetical protein